jgi:3-methyl-2-oxobutanoate hydroxymethyltransferase
VEEKVTVPYLLKKKQQGSKITIVTAYDYPTAFLLDRAGIDIVIVGDSVGNCCLGYKNTIPVTLDEILNHTKAVSKACKRSLVLGDMPYLSYEVSIQDAIYNAGRLIKEGGAEAVKIEGGAEYSDVVRGFVRARIPVMGHLGLNPQSFNILGGYRQPGKSVQEASKLLENAKALESAGVFAILLECIPWQIAKMMTESVKIPTLSVGSGKYCDGQGLVHHDILGYHSGIETLTGKPRMPRFTKQYTNLTEIIFMAFTKFKEEVSSGIFPDEEHSYSFPQELLDQLLKEIGERS